MYSSPVRHFTSVLLRLLVRLAGVKRAASVRSEPGSNSHELGVLRIWIQGPPLQYTLPCSCCYSLYSVVKEQNKPEPHTLQEKLRPCQGAFRSARESIRGSSREVSL